MKPTRNYSSGYIKVYPKSAGDFGICSMSGVYYEDDSHLRKMAEQARRHVDQVGIVEIVFADSQWYCQCGFRHNTEKEAEECCKNKETS